MNYGYAIAFTTYGTIGVKVGSTAACTAKKCSETDVRPGGRSARGRR